MVTISMLKKISFLQDLPEHILQKIGEVATIQEFDAGTVIYEQDQPQSTFYMLVSGKVGLNSKSQKGITMTLDNVLPGRIFGVPALLSDSRGSFTAVCSEPSTVIKVSGRDMRDLFTQNFEIGHIVMRKMVKMYKSRRDMHTEQFLKFLKTHPEIRKLQD